MSRWGMSKLVLSVSFFIVTPVLLVCCIVFYSFVSYHKTRPFVLGASAADLKPVAYASIPLNQSISQEKISQKDARVEIVKQFFVRYDSPLEPYAQLVVDTADYYGLDYRLLPAIGMQESNLCKKIPDNSYNCWGFGIYGKTVTRFSSYAEAIETVTKTLAKVYKTSGLDTPEEIMSRYTPSSNGSWARGVTHFMDLLK